MIESYFTIRETKDNHWLGYSNGRVDLKGIIDKNDQFTMKMMGGERETTLEELGVNPEDSEKVRMYVRVLMKNYTHRTAQDRMGVEAERGGVIVCLKEISGKVKSIYPNYGNPHF